MNLTTDSIELSIVVPTFREAGNITELVSRVREAMDSRRWEIIFVDDDSPDETASIARNLAQTDPQVRCIQRIGRRGLASACVEGMLSSSAPYLAVMDADLQHDERILPKMLSSVRDEGFDISVGSRYIEGGNLGDWDKTRASISRLATKVSHYVVPADLRDPMSGFFLIRRDAFERCVRNLSIVGFKILVDIFASSPTKLKFKEVPYTFRNRHAGESKLDSHVAWDYGMLLLDKLIGHVIPVRFVSFAFIGGLGVIVHFAVLSWVYKASHFEFVAAQATATIVAMVFNFAVNNTLTYRDKRLRGLKWLTGLASFMVACSVGAIANVGIANYIFQRDSGWVLAAIAGILVGAVWNYAVTSVYTWGAKKK